MRGARPGAFDLLQRDRPSDQAGPRRRPRWGRCARLPGGRRGGPWLPLRDGPGLRDPRPARVREEGAQVDGEAGLRGLLRGPQAQVQLLQGRDRPARTEPPAQAGRHPPLQRRPPQRDLGQRHHPVLAARRREGLPERRDRPVRRQARRLVGGHKPRCGPRELVAHEGGSRCGPARGRSSTPTADAITAGTDGRRSARTSG